MPLAEPPIQVEAVVLRTVPYGEADLVVHLFVRGRGKVGAFARSARRSGKRFGGGLEPFCVLEAQLQERPCRDLADLRSATLVEGYAALRSDLGRLAHAGYATEVVRELVRDREPHDALFETLVGFYRTLAEVPPRSLLLRAFELEALGGAGLAPVLDMCARCGRALPGAAAFDVEHGGTACESCAGPGALAMEAGALRLLRALQAGGLAAGRADEAHLPLEAVRRALRAFVDRHVHHDLRSVGFMRDVGAPP